jgi:hypothetical protein
LPTPPLQDVTPMILPIWDVAMGLMQHDGVGPFSPRLRSAPHNVVTYTQLNTAALNNSNECAFKLRVPQKTSLFFLVASG